MNPIEDSILKSTVRNYLKGGLYIVVALTLLSLAYMSVSGKAILPQILISLGYNVVISYLLITIWKLIMRHSRDSFVQFYLGGTGFRLITALFVVLIYCAFVEDLPTRLAFAAVFCLFYIVMLIYDTLFFLKVERVNMKTT